MMQLTGVEKSCRVGPVTGVVLRGVSLEGDTLVLPAKGAGR